jgi:hypothetical protein
MRGPTGRWLQPGFFFAGAIVVPGSANDGNLQKEAQTMSRKRLLVASAAVIAVLIVIALVVNFSGGFGVGEGAREGYGVDPTERLRSDHRPTMTTFFAEGFECRTLRLIVTRPLMT